MRPTAPRRVVCLNPIEELVVRYPEYVDWLRANRAGRAIWFPIENFHALRRGR